jgi:hypothetical protein
MQYLDLLGNLNNKNRLDFFTRKFFRIIDVTQIEERESSNYVNGRYFKGQLGNFHIIVSLADFVGNEDLPFWVHIKCDDSDHNALTSMINEIICNKAIPEGFQLAQMVNFGTRYERRIDYQQMILKR